MFHMGVRLLLVIAQSHDGKERVLQRGPAPAQAWLFVCLGELGPCARLLGVPSLFRNASPLDDFDLLFFTPSETTVDSEALSVIVVCDFVSISE